MPTTRWTDEDYLRDAEIEDREREDRDADGGDTAGFEDSFPAARCESCGALRHVDDLTAFPFELDSPERLVGQTVVCSDCRHLRVVV